MFTVRKSIATHANNMEHGIASGISRSGQRIDPTAYQSGRQVTTAATPSNTQVSISSLGTQINLDPMLWEVAPETLDQHAFPEVLMRVYRDIYFFDSVAGASIDLYSQLPFSNWTLTKMDEKKLLPFQESLERLNIERLLPEIAVDYMVNGAFIGNMLVSKKRKLFTDVLTMQPEFCEFTALPIWGQDPIIEYKVPPFAKKFLAKKKNTRVQSTLERMGNLAAGFEKGRFELNPLTTLFIPRRTMTTRLGTSLLKRILPIYLIEKNLWKGTMLESTRRIRSIMHIAMGDDNWEPTPQQIEEVAGLFITADADPLGAVVGTRNSVNVSEVRQGGDFWNIFNIWGDTTPAKLRALGISEAFLSGDASYNNMETSLSTFIENLRAFRFNITNAIFYSKIFPMISLMHNFVKKGEKLPAEILSAMKQKESVNSEVLLRAIQDTQALEIPRLEWTKTLEPKGDPQYFDILEKLEEKGVPVGLRAWAAAGGIDISELEQNFDNEVEVQLSVAKQKQRLKEALDKIKPKNDDAGKDDGDGGDENNDFQGEFSHDGRIFKLRKDTRKPQAALGVGKSKIVGLLNRNYGEMSELRVPSKSGNGWRPIFNQKAAQKKANENIVKALKSLGRNQHARSKKVR